MSQQSFLQSSEILSFQLVFPTCVVVTLPLIVFVTYFLYLPDDLLCEGRDAFPFAEPPVSKQ